MSARLAELLCAMSLVTDVARGHPEQEALRACLVATRLARSMGVEGSDLCDVYYATLLRYVGCTSTSHDFVRFLGGDDLAVRRSGDLIDGANPRELFAFLLGLGSGNAALRAIRTIPHAKAVKEEADRAHCDVAMRLAERFGLSESIRDALHDMFERWDGKGGPRAKGSGSVALAARFAGVAYVAAMFEPLEAASAMVKRWSGAMLDPEICSAFERNSNELLEEIRTVDPWVTVLDAEPGAPRVANEDVIDAIIRGFADVADLKSGYFSKHSSGVASLAERAAVPAGVDPVVARRCGLLHDIGRTAISTGIWERASGLTRSEWEQVRLHAYHSERILLRSPTLARYADAAGMHHERLDAGGYHRGAKGRTIPLEARLIAAADAYHAMTEQRPHRRALAQEEAARTLDAQAAQGAFDARAVSAVIEAAGMSVPKTRAQWPASLTDREVELIRVFARGATEKEAARLLFISKTTVHTHAQHIYEKAGVTSRAGLTLFAMENDLLSS